MILKFQSSALKTAYDEHTPQTVVVPARGWTWIDDVAKVEIVEDVNIPYISASGNTSSEYTEVVDSYRNPQDYFSDNHWVGVNPNLYNQHCNEECSREPAIYTMCYVHKRNGKIELLAIGFLAEVYLLNDEGKTVDSIMNTSW